MEKNTEPALTTEQYEICLKAINQDLKLLLKVMRTIMDELETAMEEGYDAHIHEQLSEISTKVAHTSKKRDWYIEQIELAEQ